VPARSAEKLPAGGESSQDAGVRGATEPSLRRVLGRGELLRLIYRLGRNAASGLLTVAGRTGRPELFVLRRGAAICADGELARRGLVARLARAVAEPSSTTTFEDGVTAYPPGAPHQVALAGWVRSHLEAQLDGSLAEALGRELTGARLTLRAELAPEPLDEADRRLLAALAAPRRLDQIWSLARAPRFRLLAFLHFLRAIGALDLEGFVSERRAPVRGPDPRRAAALRLLGVDDAADADAVKRAYRRLARSLHPDLQPGADDQQRRTLERRFAEVTAAYESLV
jgi:DnaJ-domain-containing protein 1